MKNYVFLYFYEKMDTPPSEGAMAAWMKWFESLGDKIVDSGNPFINGAKAEVKDGVITKNDDFITGYSVVKAANLDEATAMAKSCPMAVGDDSWIRVYETGEM